MAVLKVMLVILACILGLLLVLAALLILLRYKLYIKLALEGIRADIDVAIGVGRKKLIRYTAAVFYKDGWHYELHGPFEDRIKKKIDETLEQQPKEAAPAEEAEQPPEKPKKPSTFMQRLTDELIKSVHIARWRVRARIGIADDAMATAMTTGYVMIFINALSAVFVSHFKNDNPIDTSVEPVFNENKLSILFDIVLTLRVMDGLKNTLRRKR